MQSSVCLLIKVWSSISLETIKKTIIGEALFETEVVLPHWAAALKGGDLFPQLQSRVDSETSQREYAHMQRLDYETAANGKQNLDFNLSLTQGALEYRRVYDW